MIDLEKQLGDAIGLMVALQDPNHIQRRNFEKIVNTLCTVISAGKKILICGNGGSLCDAMHFAEELTGRYRLDRPAMRAIALADSAHMSCTTNDYGQEFVFSRLVSAYGNSGDALICLSTSGNSPNIIKAIEEAKANGIVTIGFTGKLGGKLREMADLHFHVDAQHSERIQEVHMFFLHCLVEELEKHLYPKLYAPK